MTSDLVERLRAGICDDPCRVRDIPSGCTCAEAAAEIERLRAALREIHAAAGNNHLIANIARAALEDRT